MKEVCIDVRMLNASGIGTYLQNLLPYLEKEYRLILLGSEKEITAIGLKNIEIIPVNSSIYSIKEQIEIPFKTPKSDLFWSPHYNVPILPIRAKKRITTIHDAFHLAHLNTLSPFQQIYVKVFFNAAVKLSDTIITVSHFSKKELLKYLIVNEQKIHVIHNAASPIFIVNNNEEKKSIQINYSLPDNFILFVGNIKPHKNITNLIKAFSILKGENPDQYKDWKLVIAGKRKGLITAIQNLERLIESLNLQSEIVFIENIHTKELASLYNLAKLLILPSFYEGFGLPPLEAMNCGCPTVVSDIECFREIYQNHSVYVSPTKTLSIKEGMETVINDSTLRKRLIQEGKEFTKKYSWEKSANQHINIFDKLIFQK